MGLFRRISLGCNVSKSDTMTFHPGEIRSGMSQEAFIQIRTWEVATHREHLRRRVMCLDCGVEMKNGSLTSHRRHLHGNNQEINWYRLPVSQYKNLSQVYEVRFLRDISKCQCPLSGWPGLSRSRSGLMNHFNRMYWKDSIQILDENPTPYPHCDRCRHQVPRNS